ncbi:MAG: hypothetical protein ACRDOA_24165, partial [Streptosporangiaceae bacterium]
TKPANEADKVAAGTAVTDLEPAYPCRNHARCGGMVKAEGRRCLPCVNAVGAEAAVLLGHGMNLQDVAERYGYANGDWVFRLAAQHGHAGTKAGAARQHPRLGQRVTLWYHLRRGDAK